MIKSLNFACFAVALTTLPLSGCVSSILPDPAPADIVYRLSTQTASVAANADAAVMRVDRPAVSKALRGEDIVISPDGRRLAVAEQARWAEALPDLIQDSMLDVLSARADLVGVLPTSGARTEYRVHLTVRSFESNFDNGQGSAPLATVHYAVTFSNSSTRALLGTYDVRKTQRASSFSVPAIVEAQDSANLEALTEVADWISDVLSKTRS
ncbi:ABC-type transport auxiliary lipoprotein family protein [Fretibacter rubidus]|uniref:ABC-type transport auxiliary lipoprotein family protein n=1 Tax=Fretibacter rubidus TaxID=570162 RepID=UPI00352B948C